MYRSRGDVLEWRNCNDLAQSPHRYGRFAKRLYEEKDVSNPAGGRLEEAI
jgi:hypothetical protein